MVEKKSIDKLAFIKKSNYWPLAAVVIVIVLSCAFIFLKFIHLGEKVVETPLELAKSFLETKATIQYSITNAIGEIKKESKIVVMTAEISAYANASSEKTKFWVNLGTTTIEIKADGNKVQYILSTDVINKDSFFYDEKTGELIIKLPKPTLDESIVEVQSNPEKIEVKKDIGWARLSSYSGAYLETELKKNLRDSVIQAGKHELLLEKAQKNAEEVILKMLKEILKKEKVSIPVKINFN
jgi:hypothetical protein